MTCEPLDEAVIIAECAEREAWEAAEKAEAMRNEAIQVAAMAIRFVHDICDNQRGEK